MSFGLGLIAGAGQRITQMADQEREERMLDERMTRQEDFQREMAGLRHGYSLELQGLREAAAQRKEQEKIQQQFSAGYAQLRNYLPPEQADALMEQFQALDPSIALQSMNQILQSAAKEGSIDFNRLTMASAGREAEYDTALGATGSATDASTFAEMGVDPRELDSASQVRTAPIAATEAPRVAGAPDTGIVPIVPFYRPDPTVRLTDQQQVRITENIVNLSESVLQQELRQAQQQVAAMSADPNVSPAEREVATEHFRALTDLAANSNRDVLVTEAFGKRAIDETLSTIPEVEQSIYLSMPQYQRAQRVAMDVNNVRAFVSAPDGTVLGGATVTPASRMAAVNALVLRHGHAAVPLELKLQAVRPARVTAPTVEAPTVPTPMTDQEQAGAFFAD